MGYWFVKLKFISFDYFCMTEDRRNRFNEFMSIADGQYFESNDEMIDFMKKYADELISDEVFSAMRKVDRKEFLTDFKERSYLLRPLPIGCYQTCSAPYVVAVFNEALKLKPGEKVLEIGAGCGYHAATVGAQIGKGEVHSFDIIEELAELARRNIENARKKVDMADIHVHFGDASEGFKDEADFDAIYMTSAAPPNYDVKILLKQLKIGGRLVVPFTENSYGGRVFLFEANKDNPKVECIADMGFVPLIGKRGWKIT